MKRLRELLSEHRPAAAIIAAALVAFAVWQVFAAFRHGAPAATTSTVPPAASPSGAGGATAGGPTGDAALRAAGHLTGTAAPALPGRQPSTGAAPSGSAAAGATGRPAPPAPSAAAPSVANPPAAGTGRPDPFSPLASTGGGSSGSRPAGTNPSLPPVPPLSPGALGPSGFPTPGAPLSGAPDQTGPRGQFHLTGIVYGPVAVAILNDGAASYIVEPGDTVTPGVRIVAIDAENRSVTLASKDQSWQLRLGGGTTR